MARQKRVINGAPWRVEWRKFTKADASAAIAAVGGDIKDRALDQAWSDALRREMDLGLWDTFSPSQTPIMFDRDGNRLNGKHRLVAFVNSKLAEIVFPVISGLPREVFRSVDIDVKTRLKTSAHPERSSVARDQARVAWLQALVLGVPDVKITTREFGQLADGRWRKQLDWAGEAVPKAGGQGKAPYVAALMYAHRADPEFADKIGKSWANGGAGLPSQLLRLRDVALSARNYAGNRSQRLGHTFKMLNALALMHRGAPIPSRLNEDTKGLRYWSEKLRDGAASRWEKGALVLNSEEG